MRPRFLLHFPVGFRLHNFLVPLRFRFRDCLVFGGGFQWDFLIFPSATRTASEGVVPAVHEVPFSFFIFSSVFQGSIYLSTMPRLRYKGSISDHKSQGAGCLMGFAPILNPPQGLVLLLHHRHHLLIVRSFLFYTRLMIGESSESVEESGEAVQIG